MKNEILNQMKRHKEAADGLEANDSIRIDDGEISIVGNKDAVHSEMMTIHL